MSKFRPFEKFVLFLKIIFINKRHSLIAFLGLGISLALVAQNLIFLYSFQFNAFNTYVTENPIEQLSIYPNNMVDTFGIEETVIPDLQSIMDNSLAETNLGEITTSRTWINRRAVIMPFFDYQQNKSELLSQGLIGVSTTILEYFEPYLLKGGQLPTKTNEMIALVNPTKLTSTNISKGTTDLYVIVNPFNLYRSVQYGIPDAGAKMNITGFVDIYALQEAFNETSAEKEILRNIISINENDEMFITSRTNVIDFTSGLTGPEVYVRPYYVSFVGSILFNMNGIDAFNIEEEIIKIISFNENLKSSLELTDYIDGLDFDAQIITILQDFAEEFEIFRIFTLLFMIPVIGMALSLTAYSSNLVKKRRQQQLSLLRQRGASRLEIIALLSFELVIFTFLAIILSFLLAYPYAFLILKSDGFLNFSGEMITPQFYTFIVEIVLVVGFAASIIINFRNIWKLSNITQEEAFSEHKEEKPFWKKYFLDVFFLGLGITAWIITSIQLKNMEVSTDFARVVGAPAPILVILGGVLFLMRIFPYITKGIAELTWKIKNFEIPSLSCKSMSRRQSSITLSLILITLTCSLTILSMVIPDSYQAFDYENAQYKIGADIVISGVSKRNTAFREAIEDIEGIKDTTYVHWLNPEPVTRGGITYTYTIIGINTTEYLKIGYFEDEYLDGSISKKLATINQEKEEGIYANVIAQQDQLKPYDRTIGDTVNIYENYWEGTVQKQRNYTVEITALYNYWPVIYQKKPDIVTSKFHLSLVTNNEDIYD
ncbi:ABC transporter permease, partial [Candidatus Heimdallarchaeota archaeon]